VCAPESLGSSRPWKIDCTTLVTDSDRLIKVRFCMFVAVGSLLVAVGSLLVAVGSLLFLSCVSLCFASKAEEEEEEALPVPFCAKREAHAPLWPSCQPATWHCFPQ